MAIWESYNAKEKNKVPIDGRMISTG